MAPDQRKIGPYVGEKLKQEDLEKFLWKSADILRGSIDSSEYKHYIFGLLFLKRLSDQFDEEREQVEGDPEDPDNYLFFVPERARWNNIRNVSEGIGNAIDKAFEALEEANSSLVEVLSFDQVISRLAKLILKQSDPERGLLPLFTQQDLAAMVGTSRVVVNRSLKAMEDKGAIRLERRRIVITDENALKKLIR